MENYDPRRRHSSQDPQQRDRSRRYEGGAEEEHDPREFADDDRQSRRYGTENFGRSDYGARERPDRERPERESSSFSPDWSRDDAEPLYSDDPYCSRGMKPRSRCSAVVRRHWSPRQPPVSSLRSRSCRSKSRLRE